MVRLDLETRAIGNWTNLLVTPSFVLRSVHLPLSIYCNTSFCLRIRTSCVYGNFKRLFLSQGNYFMGLKPTFNFGQLHVCKIKA